MKKIHVIATTRRGTTPPGASHRTPLARGELGSCWYDAKVPLWLEGCPRCSVAKAGRGVVINNQHQ